MFSFAERLAGHATNYAKTVLEDTIKIKISQQTLQITTMVVTFFTGMMVTLVLVKAIVPLADKFVFVAMLLPIVTIAAIGFVSIIAANILTANESNPG